MSEAAPDDDAAGLRARFLRGFPAIALAIFLSAVDQTITATALPAIAADMGALDRVSWIVVAYLVAATCAAPVFGQLGDVFGRRHLVFVALGFVAAGCLGSSLAPNLPALAAARVLQGIGGGALYTLAQSLIGEAVRPRERGRFQAYIAGTFASAAAFGPVAGGFVTHWFGWRAVFLVLLPFALLCAAMVRRLPVVPLARHGARLVFDWAGLGLFILGVATALVALDRARRMDLALLPYAALLGLIAAAAFWLLIKVERAAQDPLLPLPMLAEPSIWRSLLISALVAGTLVGVVAFLPIYFQAARGFTAAASGLALLPISAGGASGALFAGRMANRTGRGMVWPSYGLALATLVIAAIAATPSLPSSALPLLLAIAAFGCGTAYPIIQTTVQSAAGRERLGSAAAGVAFSRNLGAAAGTALLGAVLFAAVALAAPGTAPLFARIIAEGPSIADAALRHELAGAFRALFATAALLLGVAALLAQRVPLRRF